MIKQHSSAGQEETFAVMLAALYLAIIATGLYGLVLDCFHSHWAFVALDLLSGGIVGVIRGVGYFFGWIAY